MRDTHEQLPELIAATERGGQYFGAVRVTLGDQSKTFEFGVDRSAFAVLKRMMAQRPFDTMAGTPYRYFFVPSVRSSLSGMDAATRDVAIRVEQGRQSKQVEVTAPIGLIQNLMWFFQLKDFGEAKELREIKEDPTSP